jgi:hypothetical protein
VSKSSENKKLSERYNRDYNNLLDSPQPGLFAFWERGREGQCIERKDMRML